jgi:hypothetical protein
VKAGEVFLFLVLLQNPASRSGFFISKFGAETIDCLKARKTADCFRVTQFDKKIFGLIEIYSGRRGRKRVLKIFDIFFVGHIKQL